MPDSSMGHGTTCPPLCLLPETSVRLHFDGKEQGVQERLTLKDMVGISLCLVSEEVA